MPLKRLALLLIAIAMLPVTVWAEEVDAAVDEPLATTESSAAIATDAEEVAADEMAAQIDPAPEADSHPADDSSHSYFYMGGAFTVGIENFDKAAGRASSDEAYGFDMWLGYRMNRYLGFEGRLGHITGFDTKF